jgi:flagellar motor switch protein FliG
MSEKTEQGIFINGRQQIIEMLQFMNEDEKQKLLGNIKQRNAVMARELTEQSFSFKSLFSLSQDSLKKIFSRTNPAIIALALYPLEKKFQQKALSALDRPTAEQAFTIMNQNLSDKKQESRRAQEKIIQFAIQLSRQQYINI